MKEKGVPKPELGKVYNTNTDTDLYIISSLQRVTVSYNPSKLSDFLLFLVLPLFDPSFYLFFHACMKPFIRFVAKYRLKTLHNATIT